jgi:hypothetical protein
MQTTLQTNSCSLPHELMSKKEFGNQKIIVAYSRVRIVHTDLRRSSNGQRTFGMLKKNRKQ